MKRNLFRTMVLGTSALIGLSLLNAQGRRILTATIPFDFVAGQKLIQAGECVVDVQSNPAVIALNCGKGNAVFLLANYVEAKGANDAASLMFHRYGDQYFLSQIWPGASRTGRQLPVSLRERELMKTAGVPASAVIVAKR